MPKPMRSDRQIFVVPGASKSECATIELLAMALWHDHLDISGKVARWCRTTHEERERFRRMAMGEADLP